MHYKSYCRKKIPCRSDFKRYLFVYSLWYYFFVYFRFVSTSFYFMKLSSSLVVYLTSCTVISKSSQSYMRFEVISLHKKWSFPLRISSVSVTKSAVLKKSLMENFIFCAVYIILCLIYFRFIECLYMHLF